MNSDSMLTHIREARHRISAGFGHDPKRLVAYYIERQRKLKTTGGCKFYEPSFREPVTDISLNDRSK